jgi:hypothetical protein
MELLAIEIIVAVVVGVVTVNVWHRRFLANMTPDERKAHDECGTRNPGDW